MPGTYVRIQSVTVGAGGAANIDFTSIPETFDDLSLFISARQVSGSPTLVMSLNNSTANFTNRYVEGNGASASSGSNAQSGRYISFPLTATASTFTSDWVYFPNYASSANKSFSIDSAVEANQTTAYLTLIAGLWSNTAAINRITILLTTGNLAEFTTATLYGIKRN